MSWKKIKLIFMREARDQLRDRRTLFMIAILPMLLYPTMGIGMMQMTLLFSEQPRTVVVLGAEHLPQQPQLLDGDRIASSWFNLPTDATKLEIVTDSNLESGNDVEAERSAMLEQSHQIRKLLTEYDLNYAVWQAAETAKDKLKAGTAGQKLLDIKTKISEVFASSRIQVLIVVPEGFGSNIQAMNRKMAEGKLSREQLVDYPRPQIVRNSADEKSQIAYRRVKTAMTAWEAEILKYRLAELDLPETLPQPVRADSLDLAAEDQLAANLWSKLFPALLVIMAVTGAFYPAVDLVAGEKERGTMETLLICPASRREIVIGKFLTVMVFSMSTAILNLLTKKRNHRSR